MFGFTAPLINDISAESAVKEKISYRHDYNSRRDPNEPERGKVRF